MNKENHTVTLPVKDYEELVNNQMPTNLKELTGGPIYEDINRVIMHAYKQSDTRGMRIYFLLPNQH